MFVLLVTSLGEQTGCLNVSNDDVPVILVHGLVKSSNDMNKLKKLIQQDYPSRKVESIEILFGSFSTVIEQQERYIKAAADSIAKAANGSQCIDLIGHSQGGFLVRAYT